MEVTEDLNTFLKDSKLFYHIHNSIYRDLQISEKNIFILTPERVLRLLAIFPDIDVDFFFYERQHISFCTFKEKAPFAIVFHYLIINLTTLQGGMLAINPS